MKHYDYTSGVQIRRLHAALHVIYPGSEHRRTRLCLAASIRGTAFPPASAHFLQVAAWARYNNSNPEVSRRLMRIAAILETP